MKRYSLPELCELFDSQPVGVVAAALLHSPDSIVTGFAAWCRVYRLSRLDEMRKAYQSLKRRQLEHERQRQMSLLG